MRTKINQLPRGKLRGVSITARNEASFGEYDLPRFNNMISLCHVFNDIKFIDASLDRFQSDLFLNKVIFIGNDDLYEGKYKNIIDFIEFKKNGVNKILVICCSADVVLLYNLDYYKSLVVNLLPKRIRKVWRFFGTEYYSLPKYQLTCYSEKTKKALHINAAYHIRASFFQILRVLKYALQLKRTPIAQFNKAIRNIDYFMSFDEGEYNHIKNDWKIFPKFMGITPLRKNERKSHVKSNKIIIGNSRAPENNHIDIIDLFERCSRKDNYTLIFPLSYGDTQRYYDHLIEKINNIKLCCEIIDQFLPYDVYVEKIANAKAAIINTYRQMALGNIFLFLGNNVKLYMSDRNPSTIWLKNLGFSILSVETNLKNDIDNNNFDLDHHLGENNRKIIDKLSDNENVKYFHRKFYELFCQEV